MTSIFPAKTLIAVALMATSFAEEAQPEAVESLGQDRYRIGLVEVDAAKRTLTIPAFLNMNEEVVEYLLVTEKGKTHESVLSTKADPTRIHLGALLLGINKLPTASLDGYVEWQGNGVLEREPLHAILEVGPGGESKREPFPKGAWTYTGSREKADKSFAAATSGSIISLIDDPDALINSTADTRANDDVHFPASGHLPPKLQMPVKLVLVFPPLPAEKTE